MEKKGTFASPAIARANRVFPVPGGPNQQDALGDAPAELLKLLRLPQELNDFLQFFFGFFDPGHVLERHLLLLAGEKPGAALPKGKRLVAPTLHLAHEENPEAQQ